MRLNANIHYRWQSSLDNIFDGSQQLKNDCLGYWQKNLCLRYIEHIKLSGNNVVKMEEKWEDPNPFVLLHLQIFNSHNGHEWNHQKDYLIRKYGLTFKKTE